MAIYSVEKERGGFFSLLSWRAILAGLFVSIFSYAILVSLGTAIGAATAEGLISEPGAGGGGGLAVGSGIWLLLSALIAVGVGGYVSSRVCAFQTVRLGRSQGLVVASVFFSFLLYGIGSTVGAIGSGTGALLGSVTGGASNVVQSSAVQNTIRQTLGEEMDLKVPVDQASQEIASRLIRGDAEGAKNYLVQNSNLSQGEVEARFAQLQADATNQIREAGQAAADAVSKASWLLFAMLLLGGVCGSVGGAIGARANIRHPIIEEVSVREEPPTSRVA